MQTKPLLIAVAAFAVTVTGVYAGGNADKILERANLTEEQKSAIEVAHELKESGDFEAARDTLLEAGFDEETLQALRGAGHAVKEEVKAAIEANDFAAYRTAVEGTPMAEHITLETEFNKLVEAHELRKEGEFEAAREIMDELGVKPRGHMKGHFKGDKLSELSDDQKEALKEARQAGDKEAAQKILEEAGVELGFHPKNQN